LILRRLKCPGTVLFKPSIASICASKAKDDFINPEDVLLSSKIYGKDHLSHERIVADIKKLKKIPRTSG
jgi:hypothetical protein